MIILTVCLFGTRRGVLAGAIGAGLSDFLGGYAVWVLPTMVLKGLWAFIAGTIAYKLLPNFKYSWLVGAIVGGIAHIIGYTFVKIRSTAPLLPSVKCSPCPCRPSQESSSAAYPTRSLYSPRRSEH